MAAKDWSGHTLSGRYHLDEHLARGGMASVWVATDVLLGRKVAVKTLHPELATDADLRTRFRREAVSAASLAHPAIVTTYDTGEDDGIAYIVMELVEGPTLRRLLDREGTLTIAESLRIGRSIAAALEHAHRNGVVHRDIKPANVLVPPDGPAKVTDFGIAKAEGTNDLTQAGTVVGTARYLAPEQLRGEPVDARADVYAAGLVLYEMLAGRLPFQGETETAAALARLTTSPAPLYEIRPDVPHGLDRVVAHCLTVDPTVRFASGAALARALDDIARGASPELPAFAPSPGSSGSAASSPGPGWTGEDATLAPGGAPTAVHARATTPDPQMWGTRPDRSTRSQGRKRPHGVLVMVAITVFAIGAGGGYLALQNDDGSGAASGDGPTPQVVSVVDFDPEGDGSEDPSRVGNLIDDNDLTVWATDEYNTRNLGGLKSGVGLQLDLASPSTIRAIAVDASESGWSAEIYVADQPAETLAGWGAPVATVEDAPAKHTVALDRTVTGEAVLVWFTFLPDSGRLTVAEIRVS